jgi:nucleotidyltransferase substrate binding protein (TIGR01987 family)
VERLKHKQDKFLRSLLALDRSIMVSLKSGFQDDFKDVLVASNIKHFEMCYEAAWLFLKLYLEAKHNQQINSPKKVFRECFALGVLDSKTTEELLNMSEARNATVHDYDQETALEECKRLQGYSITL